MEVEQATTMLTVVIFLRDVYSHLWPLPNATAQYKSILDLAKVINQKERRKKRASQLEKKE